MQMSMHKMKIHEFAKNKKFTIVLKKLLDAFLCGIFSKK